MLRMKIDQPFSQFFQNAKIYRCIVYKRSRTPLGTYFPAKKRFIFMVEVVLLEKAFHAIRGNLEGSFNHTLFALVVENFGICSFSQKAKASDPRIGALGASARIHQAASVGPESAGKRQ